MTTKASLHSSEELYGKLSLMNPNANPMLSLLLPVYYCDFGTSAGHERLSLLHPSLVSVFIILLC
jgi:hypothetical protein